MPPRRTKAVARALMHPIRALLNQRIHATGTVSLDELAKTSGHELRLVRYHAEALVALGVVQTEDDGKVSAAA